MEYLSEIISFVAGAVGGSFLTWTVSKKSADRGGSVVDQSGTKASGDVVGGSKTVIGK